MTTEVVAEQKSSSFFGLNPSKTLFVQATLLNVCLVAIIIISNTYANALFLSTYPVSWIPYWFIGQTVTDIIFFTFLTPVISKSNFKLSASALICFALIVAFLGSFVLIEHRVTPFVISLILISFGGMLGVIVNNSVASAYDVRDYKVISHKLSIISGVASFSTGIVISLTITSFGIRFLPFVVTALFLFAIYALSYLKPLPTAPSKKSTRSSSPFGYPLFVFCFIITIICTLAIGYSDYLFRLQLSSTFSKDQIGQFVAIFMSVSTFVGLLLQFNVFSWLSNRYRFGMVSTMMVMPGYFIIGALIVFIHPNIWTISIMFAGKNLFLYTYFQQLLFSHNTRHCHLLIYLYSAAIMQPPASRMPL